MPLEVATLTVQRRDLQQRNGGSVLAYLADYVRITQYNYGRIAPESPGRGLCTDHVASCTVVVLHCPTTRRTTLSHSPNFMYMTTFIPLLDWVTGGRGDEEPTTDAQMAFCAGEPDEGGRAPRPCALEAHILRGYAYAKPESGQFNHAGWMSDFREFFGMVAQARGIALSVVDSPRLLKYGAVLVDKLSGKITHVELPANVSVPTGLLLENPRIAGQYSLAQEQQNLFVGSLLNSRRAPEPAPLRLQFDVNTYRLPHPLFDEARLLLRSKRQNEPPAAQSAIISRFGRSDDWVAMGKSRLEFQTLNNLLLSAAVVRPCELCSEEGAKTCSACLGAWYCGDVHQRQDWKSHRAWCKLHPFLRDQA